MVAARPPLLTGALALETSVLNAILDAHCRGKTDISKHMNRYFAIPVDSGGMILNQLFGISEQSRGMQFNRMHVLPTMQNLCLVLKSIVRHLFDDLFPKHKAGKQLSLPQLIYLHVGEEDRQAVLEASGFILSSHKVRVANSQAGGQKTSLTNGVCIYVQEVLSIFYRDLRHRNE